MTSLQAPGVLPSAFTGKRTSPVVLPAPTVVDPNEYTRQLEAEVDQLSGQLMHTFEELNLIHDLGSTLELAGDRTAHCRKSLEKLAECLPVTTLAILLAPDSASRRDEPFSASACAVKSAGAVESAGAMEVVQTGEPLDQSLLCRIAEELGDGEAAIINYPLQSAPDITRVASVRLEQGTRESSRLLAIGRRDGEELGTVEVQLLRSVASILKAHLAIDRQFAEMRTMFSGTVLSLVSAVDAKDPYTCGHSNRVSQVAEMLAGDLGFDAESLATVRMAGLLHDIGKIGVPDAILGKPGQLTDEEFAEMKKHPELGYRILRGIRQFDPILPGVRHHHESWDGSGYPSGLVGEDIPLIARVLAVADAFDAMSSDRPYRAGMPLERVESIFRQGRGQQWDADVVDRLLGDRERMECFLQKRDELAPQIPSLDFCFSRRIGSG